jgi:regulator of protease activity HflC (stomatin/prohibitin superfamily)
VIAPEAALALRDPLAPLAGDAWIVGGCLRDALTGGIVGDVDVVVTGDPEAAAKAINDAQIKVAQENQRGSIGRAEAEREQAIRVANAQAEAKRGQNTAQAMIAKSDADLAAEQLPSVQGERKSHAATQAAPPQEGAARS